MQEIKIPEGCKASIDFEKRVVVIESEKPKFKRGDILFASDRECIWTIIYNKTENNGYYDYFAMLNNAGCILYNEICDPEFFRLATPSEQQLLFDALAKDGKKWNAETLQIEDIEKDILVPESIGIYKFGGRYQDDDGDTLIIGFNNDTQLLCYCNGQWNVVTQDKRYYDKVQCKLTQCKRKDLKAGDTAVIYQSCITKPNLDVISRYYKVLPDNRYAKVNGESVSVVTIEGKYNFYKIEPINK